MNSTSNEHRSGTVSEPSSREPAQTPESGRPSRESGGPSSVAPKIAECTTASSGTLMTCETRLQGRRRELPLLTLFSFSELTNCLDNHAPWLFSPEIARTSRERRQSNRGAKHKRQATDFSKDDRARVLGKTSETQDHLRGSKLRDEQNLQIHTREKLPFECYYGAPIGSPI